MSQHIFKAHYANQPVEVVVGYEPKKLEFFCRIFRIHQQQAVESREGIRCTVRLDEFLKSRGINAPKKVIESLETEPIKVDLYPNHGIERLVRFYENPAN